MLLYTWKDVERKIFKNRNEWDAWISEITVYADSIDVVLKKEGIESEAKTVFGKVFGNAYHSESNSIQLDFDNSSMKIYFEIADEEESNKRVYVPLFKNILYQEDAYSSDLIGTNLPGVPVLAFHSYKGGVGRTLAVLMFARAWSSFADLNRTQRLLIVDADVEAPGISWLTEKENIEPEFSYLDLLELIQQNESADDMIAGVAEKVSRQMFKIETERNITEHFVLPTYRYLEQLLDIYASPESLASSYDKKYVLAEALSKLGERLGADMVLVDLRAGLSEFSAPLLFDPRVKKYLVTSTSRQSVKGTEILLGQLCKGLPISGDSMIPEILLTMVQKNVNTENIISELVSIYDANIDDENVSITDSIVTQLPFASELVHLESLNQIMSNLGERDAYKVILKLIESSYLQPVDIVSLLPREEAIPNIHRYAQQRITAEGNGALDILMTDSISNLIKRYRNAVPNTVIIGAKGSGKTFLYREILRNSYWERFVAEQYGENWNEGRYDRLTIVVPLLASSNAIGFQDIMSNAIQSANQFLETNMSRAVCSDNKDKIVRYAKQNHSELEWKKMWQELILESFGNAYASMQKLDDVLEEKKKKIMFVMDGLEEILLKVDSSETEKRAIASLCTDVITELTMKYRNIGLIVFIRKDMVRDAIEVNYEQFYSLYSQMELKWSSTEALRLALWVVNQAVPGFYQESLEKVSIEKASREIIEQSLCRLWGLKLGKPTSNEANSSRWILAALSDFNGQLQARDIIRFLTKATETIGKKVYEDRYLMPTEIKKAVSSCSVDKFNEIKQEIQKLKPIFDKLESASEEKKRLPFCSSTFNLSQNEEKLLIQEGYLRIENDKYYLPEIIRHALKFKYEKGARPKVLALLLK